MSIFSRAISVVFLLVGCLFSLISLSNCCVVNHISMTNETDKNIRVVSCGEKIGDNEKTDIMIPPYGEEEFLMNDVTVFSENDHIFIDKKKWISIFNEKIEKKINFMPNFSCAGTDVVFFVYIKKKNGKLYLDYTGGIKNDSNRRGVEIKQTIKSNLRKR